MAPPPRLTVSEWADAYRHLSPEASAEPGRWDTARAEYQRGIMDAISDPRCETVVIMSSAQVGKTEIVNNLTGYHVHQDPAPILIIQPTTEMGEAWSKDRLAPMLRDSPALRGRVSEAKTRSSGNTLRQKKFPGGHIAIAGANSAASLASRPIRILCCDEVDRYPPSAGSEGDPVTLGKKRTTTFWNRKIVLVSTPTTAGVSRIEAAFLAGDRRRYWVACPHCKEAQTLRWAQVKWPEGRPEDARYQCATDGCGTEWSDVERWAAVRHAPRQGGGWRAEGEFRGTASFHLSELYSPWRRLSETVADFLAAKDRPEMLKTWVNTALGETWQEKGDAPDWQRLHERKEDYPEHWAPDDALAVTAGVDVQGARLEGYKWAWSRGMTSRLVARTIINGDPAQPDVWAELVEWLDLPVRREGGGTLRLLRCGVDTGFNTAAVYAQIRALRDPRVLAFKGVEKIGASSPVSGPTSVDVTERGKKVRGGLKLWTVAVSQLKTELYRRLWLAGVEDGYPVGWVHLPAWAPAEVFKQLVAEQLVTVKDRKGYLRQEWKPLRERNEALDCAVYARAALWVAGADRRGDRFWTELAAELEAETVRPARAVSAEPESEPERPVAAARVPPTRESAWLGRRGGSWLRG